MPTAQEQRLLQKIEHETKQLEKTKEQLRKLRKEQTIVKDRHGHVIKDGDIFLYDCFLGTFETINGIRYVIFQDGVTSTVADWWTPADSKLVTYIGKPHKIEKYLENIENIRTGLNILSRHKESVREIYTLGDCLHVVLDILVPDTDKDYLNTIDWEQSTKNTNEWNHELYNGKI